MISLVIMKLVMVISLVGHDFSCFSKDKKARCARSYEMDKHESSEHEPGELEPEAPEIDDDGDDDPTSIGMQEASHPTQPVEYDNDQSMGSVPVSEPASPTTSARLSGIIQRSIDALFKRFRRE